MVSFPVSCARVRNLHHLLRPIEKLAVSELRISNSISTGRLDMCKRVTDSRVRRIARCQDLFVQQNRRTLH
jgi:hypothetical protein